MGAMSETEHQPKEESKIDLASIFPSKGDPRRPPEWYSRALLYLVIAVYIGWFCFSSWGKISYIVLDVVIALFLALAVEPLIIKLIKHGWKRGAAAVACLSGLIIIIVALLALFGNMFVQQMMSMLKGIPDLYNQLVESLQEYAHVQLPQMSDLGSEVMKNVKSSWVTDVAGQAVSTTVGVLGNLLNLVTAIMVAFYIAIAGPRLRRSLCQWLAPRAQRKFLLTWTVVQDQISSYLFSRSILAAISATCMSIFLVIIKVPYWLPLALFCGIVSQFIPTIGTYLGGALPVLFAWGERGIWYAVGVVVFITCYQQIENLLLAPKISEKTMDLNPCVAFLCVLFFGSIFGALGAFLALPITAALQVLFKVYTKRYQLVDMPLMEDPVPTKKSKVAEAGEALGEMAQHLPRAARGSSGHVTMDDEIRALQQAAYDLPDTHESPRQREEDPTVAIPKGVLRKEQPAKTKLDGLRGVGDEDSSQDSDSRAASEASATAGGASAAAEAPAVAGGEAAQPAHAADRKDGGVESSGSASGAAAEGNAQAGADASGSGADGRASGDGHAAAQPEAGEGGKAPDTKNPRRNWR